MAVGAEWGCSQRISKRTRLLRQAAFSDPETNVIDTRYDAGRKLDKVKIAELANREWAKAYRNVAVTGTLGGESPGSSEPVWRIELGQHLIVNRVQFCLEVVWKAIAEACEIF